MGAKAARRLNVSIQAEDLRLPGELVLPRPCPGAVVFAHGSGSSRHSPRNRYVAEALQNAGLATLLFDLLTPYEATDRRLVFDIPLLASRLATATEWLHANEPTSGLPLGLFGASTGAAAALVHAARQGAVNAVVSRGGRPDLAGDWLGGVRAPTLLIVGAADREVLELNRLALERLGGEKELAVVPGATHLFEERGALEQVAQLAADWFGRYLTA